MQMITTGRSNYPYMEAEAGELTVKDVERLLSLYKDVVTKYTTLCKAVTGSSRTDHSAPHLEGTSFSLTQTKGNTGNSSNKET